VTIYIAKLLSTGISSYTKLCIPITVMIQTVIANCKVVVSYSYVKIKFRCVATSLAIVVCWLYYTVPGTQE